MSLQIRRGTDAERLTITPLEGELIYCTDTQLTYIGDGTTVGGIAAGGGDSFPAAFIVNGSGTSLFIGDNSGTSNTANNNLGFGLNALSSVTTSVSNTALGVDSLKTLTGGGGENTAVGYNSGNSLTTGRRNAMVGSFAGYRLTTGERNASLGRDAGRYCLPGLSQTVYLGQQAGMFAQNGLAVGVGRSAGSSGGTGSIAIGGWSLNKDTRVSITNLVPGSSYIISNPGSSDWTSVGASDSNEATVFTATSTGTGDGSCYVIGSSLCANNIGIGNNAGLPTSFTEVWGSDNIYLGANTAPSTRDDTNTIVIGTGATSLGSNTALIGNSSNTLVAINGSLVVSKATGVGIKVDLTAPTYPWRDIVASMKARATGPTVPTYVAYAGTSIYGYQFSNSATQELFVEFHIPHDYVPGSELFIHTHWSQTTADAGTAVKWNYDCLYAKGHDQEAFPGTVTTVSATQSASSTVRQHMVAEVQLTTSGALGGQAIEADGIILVRMWRDPADAADTLTVAPFAHFCDIHYQSTNIGTKNKSPDFFA